MVDFSDIGVIVTLVLAVAAFVVFDVFIQKVTRKFRHVFVSCGVELLILVAYIFNMWFFVLVAGAFLQLFFIILSFFYMRNVREFFGKPLDKAFQKTKKNIKGELIYDHDYVLGIIKEAATTMSKQKIGAIITFQKHDALDEFTESGTKLNAPVSAELLETIFYPGSRLHDGAVIIRGTFIDSASVYFTPTTKPLSGKFGSRHRAAIGISEVSDSVTLVISEETGRISIAHEGELEHVSPDNFIDRLDALLSAR